MGDAVKFTSAGEGLRNLDSLKHIQLQGEIFT